MIVLKNVTLRRGTKVLLDQASVTLNPGEKVGLVGRNGAGKSTLFALFNGSLNEDGGDFDMPKAWRMAQVAQNMPETRRVRFRTLGCYPLSGAIESEATTVPEVIEEMLSTGSSERQGRLIDHDGAASMERKKQEGYF